MKKIQLFFFIVCFLFCENVSAQSLEKPVRDAFMISRMVERFHIQPRPLDDEMSAAIYSRMLDDLDDEKTFFLQEDINKLSAYQFKIDEEIKNRQFGFLQLLINTYKLRLQQADTMVDDICKNPFNFYMKEKLTIAEDTSYPANIAAMHNKIYKIMKLYMLASLKKMDDISGSGKTFSRKQIDSLEPIVRKKAISTMKRWVKRILQSPQGIEYIIGNIYCETLASCYDPHTDYFPPDVKTSFESMLGNKPLVFGFSLVENEDGNPEIGRLQPGSPAFLCGQINEGDKILNIKWENKETIDVSDASLQELNHMLAASGGDKITITVKKADGTTKQATLHKEKLQTDDEDDNTVKGFLLKGNKTVGYISLPDFYSDWDNESGVNGCANDVAKEIVKLKKENIDGLILDLRYNGGGSIKEAVDLAGIFIDAGPVAEVKKRDAKMITLKDVNRGTIYDGPLVILVNGSTASASELVAGTLQDYNRALIVGSTTYGKATGELVLPLDTTINIDTYNGKAEALGYIKLTTIKLFRVNGTTAQRNGVMPNIILPDPTDAQKERESNEKFAIPASYADANKYYTPFAPINVIAANDIAKKEIDSSDYIKQVIQYVEKTKMPQRKKEASLFLDDFMKQKDEENDAPDIDDYPEKTHIFSVINNAYEQRRIQANKNFQETNDEMKKNLSGDPYIKIGYSVITTMIK